MPEFAFYYPNPMWQSGDWVKNLILFFDGVALLVPSYMTDRPRLQDPAIVAGLEEAGLLRILKPETLMDRAAAETLTAALADVIASGAFDRLPETQEFHELSLSRLGGLVDPGLATMIVEELESRGLAKATADGLSVPLHPLVRSLVLVLLAQILRPGGIREGIQLSPTTDRSDIQTALRELLDLPSMPSTGHVIARDLEVVGIDLAGTPLDEVLEFKEQHGEQFRSYRRALRALVRELSVLDQEAQAVALSDREELLTDLAESLRKLARSRWKGRLSVGLGIAGAAWQTAAGDVLGGLFALGAGGLAAAASRGPSVEANPYSYLFAAHERFAG